MAPQIPIRESGDETEGCRGVTQGYWNRPVLPPQDVRPPPNTEIRRSTPEFSNAGHASPKHYVAHGGHQDRNPRIDRQGVNNPRHGNEPMPDRREQLGPGAPSR